MFAQVVGILFPVFAITLVGFFIGRWLKPDFKPINRINMDVLVPALVFSSLAVMPMEMGQLPLITASVVAVLLPGLLMVPICKVFKLNFKIWAPSNMFRNSGNLAIPLFTYTFGDTALAPAVLLFVISSCAHLSIGIALLSDGSPIKKMLTMPVFLAALLGLVLNLSGVGIWKPLYDATHLLGGASIPIMLLSLGSQMCNIRLSGLKVGIMCTVLSFVTGAIAFIAIYLFIPLPTLHLQMLLLFTMLPPAVMNYMLAERFNIGPEKVASMVLFSNFFSIITLPIVLVIALSLG
ncbi:AEC family transporter [Psychromonas sp. 14N.309.X.WAT.B.A12]|uniref:AEC family transporter n=1 Tax=unclassified Psychromonas TaxID=2614957 RepID=UPI0025AEEC05|nr:AEC family transporter [Psychromonas sp. 14N.309.X.WAT.B.A12]MDN2663708.1 AEC family transporter [Psychromonas sp. 14N.309.X.WAT.B.A12]